MRLLPSWSIGVKVPDITVFTGVLGVKGPYKVTAFPGILGMKVPYG